MTTGRINQIAIFFVCVISGFSSLARREYPKRNEVRQNELTNFHKSSARAWLCESESKSAGFRTQTAKSLCRSEEHTSELQSLMRRSYAVFCLKKKKINNV